MYNPISQMKTFKWKKVVKEETKRRERKPTFRKLERNLKQRKVETKQRKGREET